MANILTDTLGIFVQYEASYPRPIIYLESDNVVPPEHAALIKICAYGNGTPSDKKKLLESKLIQQKKNKILAKEYGKRQVQDSEWWHEMQDVQNNWIKENYNPPDHLKEVMPYCKFNTYSDTRFNYEDCFFID